MKQYFLKYQSLEPPDDTLEDKASFQFVASNHDSSGPIKISFPTSVTPLDDAALAAAEQISGLTAKPQGPWGGDHMGVYHGQATIARTGPNKGQRSYAARDYFLAASARPNLKILLESMVCRVVLGESVATGAKCISAGHRYMINAKR